MKSQGIDRDLKAYMQLKIDLLKITECIDYCTEEKDKEYFRMKALHYSKELKKLREYIEEIYGLKLCQCCFFTESE
ncbi:hypothetical protein [Saccharococcus caldoxylosilyticus]|jgi:hypothetical protein|uniref:Uncharacterized protein n=1 Tax=Saccharococcus caldoxylosilyticus TaxID=81408 RepID=A0A150M6D6_9BACL|nr:hypothetical protein [Parageobacillus caldoxylosilyticus]KYD20098.1 hypothetical protein B4119_3990 [Parageobacillus caldoxylosilyticus]